MKGLFNEIKYTNKYNFYIVVNIFYNISSMKNGNNNINSLLFIDPQKFFFFLHVII